jgi:hypothetical protein
VHQGLHEFPERLNRTLKEELCSVDDGYDYIVLNYGLCGNGTLSVSHPTIPLIVHQVHDCIPLLMGARDRYARYLYEHPGTFWLSPGWIEGFPLSGAPDYAEKYREHYGKEVIERQQVMLERMLMEHYDRLLYVHWECLGDALADRCRAYVRSCADALTGRLGRSFTAEEMPGSPDMLQRFVDGAWTDENALLVPPGYRLRLNPHTSRLYAEQETEPGD